MLAVYYVPQIEDNIWVYLCIFATRSVLLLAFPISYFGWRSPYFSRFTKNTLPCIASLFLYNPICESEDTTLKLLASKSKRPLDPLSSEDATLSK